MQERGVNAQVLPWTGPSWALSSAQEVPAADVLNMKSLRQKSCTGEEPRMGRRRVSLTWKNPFSQPSWFGRVAPEGILTSVFFTQEKDHILYIYTHTHIHSHYNMFIYKYYYIICIYNLYNIYI